MSDEIVSVLGAFAPLFSARVWSHAQVLLTGALLCHGQRTVTACLRVMGLRHERHFTNYHRVLNRACWSGIAGAKILLGLLVALVPAKFPLLIGVDETIERRRGAKISAKGCYRDAVRSTRKHVVRCFGLKWLSLQLLVVLPWSQRAWGLPFFTVLTPSESANQAAGRRHKTSIDWSLQLVHVVSRWLEGRSVFLVGDGGFGCVRLAHGCLKHGWSLVSKLRQDARLFDFPGESPPGKRGPKPQKGKRLPSLKSRQDEARCHGEEATVNWYGNTKRTVRFLTGVCLWHTPGQKPVPILWVLVVDPTGKYRPEAFFTTDLALKPRKVVQMYVLRWGVEVTFEECRRHLGMETQRQWSDKAIARTTPVLLALFALVCLTAHALSKRKTLIPQQTAWYQKDQVTFADVLTYVRTYLWQEKLNNSCRHADFTNSNDPLTNTIIDLLAQAA